MPEVTNENQVQEDPKFRVKSRNFERSWDDESRWKDGHPKGVSLSDWLALVDQLRRFPTYFLDGLQDLLRIGNLTEKELKVRRQQDRSLLTSSGKETLKFVWGDGPPYPVVLTNKVEHHVKEGKNEYSCSYTISSQSDLDGEKFTIKDTLKWDDVQVELGDEQERVGRSSKPGSSLTGSAQTGAIVPTGDEISGEVDVSGSHPEGTSFTAQTFQE